jgi:hypothetical protein
MRWWWLKRGMGMSALVFVLGWGLGVIRLALAAPQAAGGAGLDRAVLRASPARLHVILT